MLIRRELATDHIAVREVHAAAFDRGSASPPEEVRLVQQLRIGDAWRPELSWVAVDHDLVAGRVVGHVVCTVAHVDEVAVVALGPLGVHPEHQGCGIGSALVHAVIGAADAVDAPLVGLLGAPEYYGRFGFVPSVDVGIEPPDPTWGAYFQIRPLTRHRDTIRGRFRYAPPFGA